MVEVETFDKAAHAKEYTTVHEYNTGVLFDSFRIVAEIFSSDEAGNDGLWGVLLDSKFHVLVDCLSDIVDAFDSFAFWYNVEAYLVTETDGDDFSVVVAETTTDCALCNVVAEVQGSEAVPVLFPKAPVCEKTTAL